MMYTPKGWRATATLLALFALCQGHPLGEERQLRQRYSSPTVAPFPRYLALPWEFVLREIILKSIVPPLDADISRKRPLDASFYGGPLATHSNDDTNVVLSRGNVYRLLNGHWMLCQDGCVDCEPCMAQTDPLFKWTLRRIQRLPSADDHPRHELQLTITPQTDDRLHASDFWPNSHVYVMSQGLRETSIVSVGTSPFDDGFSTPEDSSTETTSSGLEDSFSLQHHRVRNTWRLAERDSSANRNDNPATTRESAESSTERTTSIEKKESPEQKQRFANTGPRYRPRLYRPMENHGEEASQLLPKLILGIDSHGQKHLVHVIPITTTANHLVSSQMSQTLRSNDTMVPHDGLRDRQTQRIFRRIFNSLNAHRRSIEDFLEMNNVSEHHQTPSVIDDTNVAGFTWNDRGINHAIANFTSLHHGDTALLPLYAENEDKTAARRQYRGRYGYEDTEQNINNHYARYRDTNHAETSRNQSPMSSDWDEERRKLRIKPYATNSRSISETSSSISSQTSGNFSMDINSRSGFSNGFVNSTLIDKTNSNSIGPSSITTRRGNGQLFKSDRLKSGDSNREFEASHHPFRIIVTTESPVIRGEHEALNHTKHYK